MHLQSQNNITYKLFTLVFTYDRSVHLEKKDLQSHLDQAARSCRLTETLMNHIEELCLVPNDLMTQLRHNNELYQCRLKENNNPVSVYYLVPISCV